MATNGGSEEEELVKIKELEERVKDLNTDDDDPGFLTHQTYRRYLVARDWNIDAAEKMLKASIIWRHETKPHHVTCTFCDNTPGFHSMRHIGDDKLGRPVLYANFAQCQTQHNTAEDSIQHIIYLIENAKRIMPSDVYQYVWVMDFTGMKVASCSPRQARGVEQIVSNHYPERLGCFIGVNHGALFQAFWSTVKHFVPPATVKKVHVHRSQDKIDALFSELFSEELKQWLYDEIRLNHQHPISIQQKEFWKFDKTHDSRGCSSYISKYIDTFNVDNYINNKCVSMYLPHPNIITDIVNAEQ
ncbi:hypothetical protein ACF0H5_006127 [Mactra antiquata]